MNTYYLGKNGKIYSGFDLVKSLYVMKGIEITEDLLPYNLVHFQSIRMKIEPTVEDFIKADQVAHAVKFYYDEANKHDPKNPYKERVSLSTARIEVEKIRKRMEKELVH